MERKLELRMYGFVPYNISEIQKGIQFGHSVVEYGLEYGLVSDKYFEWAKNWKTFIILNGGTSNNNPDRFGTINQTFNILKENGIVCSSFSEPDLGDQMTAISFIIDERVFNRKEYLDFGDWIMENHFSYLKNNMLTGSKIERMRKEGYFSSASDKEQKLYSEWVEFVGGDQNVFLRDFLNPNKVKLA